MKHTIRCICGDSIRINTHFHIDATMRRYKFMKEHWGCRLQFDAEVKTYALRSRLRAA